MQFEHCSASVSVDMRPAAHASQRLGFGSFRSFTYCPGTHGVVRSQNGCPEASWYVFFGQSKQLGAFVALLNLPAAHAAHIRSDVAVGGLTTCFPSKHVECTRQKLLPISGWYHPGAHGEHSLALSSTAKRPRSQLLHTSAFTNVPGLHVPQ